MIIRTMLLTALVTVSGAQSVLHASGEPKAKNEHTESWSAWYKRNKVLVGAASGALIGGVLSLIAVQRHQRIMRPSSSDILALTALSALGGALAARFNALAAYCGFASFAFLPSVAQGPQESLGSNLMPGVVGAGIGALSSKRKILPGFVTGGIGLAILGGDAVLLAPGAIVGAAINELYNQDQEPESEPSK